MATETWKANKTIRARCGNTSFDVLEGKTVTVLNRDEKANKVLIQFSKKLMDWFHFKYLEHNFTEVKE